MTFLVDKQCQVASQKQRENAWALLPLLQVGLLKISGVTLPDWAESVLQRNSKMLLYLCRCHGIFWVEEMYPFSWQLRDMTIAAPNTCNRQPQMSRESTMGADFCGDLSHQHSLVWKMTESSSPSWSELHATVISEELDISLYHLLSIICYIILYISLYCIFNLLEKIGRKMNKKYKNGIGQIWVSLLLPCLI